jgi:hypothetical protein
MPNNIPPTHNLPPQTPKGFHDPNYHPGTNFPVKGEKKEELTPSDEAFQAGIQFAHDNPDASTRDVRAESTKYEDRAAFKDGYWGKINK